nr:helicase associated domain-containing protein [Streptomyces sp. SS1-1]
MAAARQFHAREGHLRVPRQHREEIDGKQLGLGSFIANARRRAAKLSPQRKAALDALGMRCERRSSTGQDVTCWLPRAVELCAFCGELVDEVGRRWGAGAG